MEKCLKKYPRHNINALNIISVIMDLEKGRKRNVNNHDESSPSSGDINAHIINIHT